MKSEKLLDVQAKLVEMQQQSQELFRTVEQYQHILSTRLANYSVYEEEYSLEMLPINRYKVVVEKLQLEKKEVYSYHEEGIVLLFGKCDRKIIAWIESLGLTAQQVPDNIFDSEMEAYFEQSIVGVLGISKKGWSEDQCFGFVRQMFFAAKYTSITWYKKRTKPFFCVVTRLGGRFGIGSSDKEFVVGSLSGLVKTATREWQSNVSTHYIDVCAQIKEKQLIECIDQEIRFGVEAEIGYTDTMQRVGLRLKEKYEYQLDKNKPTKDDVFLVSGGGRGITSLCVIEMAKKFQCKFILFGRTEINEKVIDEYKDFSLEEIRELLLREKQANNMQIKYAKVNKEAREILAQLEIRRTLKEIRGVGSEVLYFSCDVRETKQLRAIIKEGGQKLGRITGIIHGAGVLADKLLNKKTEEDFLEVIGVKYYGINNMMNEVGSDNVNFIFTFSSIAGFFGNFGQSDYSCGNEYLNHFVRYWKHKKPECKIMAINWGPWNAGMVDQALRTAMVRRGKILIQPDIGKLFFTDAFVKSMDEATCQIIINDVVDLGGTV